MNKLQGELVSTVLSEDTRKTEEEIAAQKELQLKKIQIRKWIWKIAAMSIIVLLTFGQVPAIHYISVSADYTGDGTRIKAFLDVEANVSDDDAATWRIAQSRISVFDQADFRMSLRSDATGVQQDFGRLDYNDLGPDDLVDLGTADVDKDFSELEDSINYNATFDGGNTTDIAAHVFLFDVRTKTGGTAGIISGGFSNSSGGNVHASTTFFSDEILSTQKSIYVRIDQYAIDTTFAQYYLRSINTTNLEYSEMRVYSGNDIFLSSNEFDQNLAGTEFDASSALNGNVTGTDTQSRIVRALIRVPDSIFRPKKVQYSELGGFMNLHETLKEALKVKSGEDYNLTKFNLQLILPGDLTQQIKQRFDQITDTSGNNEQGWQSALNSLRSEFIAHLGIARFNDVPMDASFTHEKFLDSGADVGNFDGLSDKVEDYSDLAKSALTTASAAGSSISKSDLKLESDLLSPFTDRGKGGGDWFSGKSLDLGWISSGWDSVKGAFSFEGFNGVTGFFNNVSEWFDDNLVLIIVVLIIVGLLAAALVMRRRSARVGENEVMF